MNNIEELISERAYELWERAGRPNGNSLEYWFAAKAEFERKEATGERNFGVPVRRHVGPCRHESAADWGKRWREPSD